MSKMPCHISDGPQEPEDVFDSCSRQDLDEDAAYETYRQERIDSGLCMTCGNHHLPDKIFCADCLEPDPTPWCHVCGAKEKKDCQCGPLAPNR